MSVRPEIHATFSTCIGCTANSAAARKAARGLSPIRVATAKASAHGSGVKACEVLPAQRPHGNHTLRAQLRCHQRYELDAGETSAGNMRQRRGIDDDEIPQTVPTVLKPSPDVVLYEDKTRNTHTIGA